MKKFFLFALMMVFVSFGYTSFAQGLKAPGKDVIGTKVDKSREASTYKLPATDVAVPRPDTKTRGTCCTINFENWTGYTVHIWVNNIFKGTLVPWQDGSLCVASIWPKWYARTAGGTYEWSGDVDCQGNYSIKLK